MTSQPNTQTEQTTDPAVRARLMAACDAVDVAAYRQRLIRASRPSARACRALRTR